MEKVTTSAITIRENLREWNDSSALNALKMNPTLTKLKHFLNNFKVDLENGIAYKKK